MEALAPSSPGPSSVVLLSPDPGPQAPEIVGHEPLEALVSGPEGLDLIKRLTAQAPDHLAPGGWLLMEIGAGQAEKVMGLLPEERWTDREVLPDLAGIPRVVKARLAG